MTEPGPCKRCGGRMNVLGLSRAWCMKPSVQGGCGRVFWYDDEQQRWKLLYTRKVATIDPIVKDKPKKEVAA